MQIALKFVVLSSLALSLSGRAAEPAAGTQAIAAATTAGTWKVESTDFLKVLLTEGLKESGITANAIEPHDNQCWVTARTTTARLARFLLLIDTTDWDIRADTVKIQSRTPGQDDLDVEIHISMNVPKKDFAISFDRGLRAVTELFPQQGNTLWATGITNDQSNWEVVGQCTDEKYARDVVAKMAADPRFDTPKLTVSPAKDKTIPFTLTFLFPPSPATAPATAPVSSRPTATTRPVSRIP